MVREYHEQVRQSSWITTDVWERAITTLLRTEQWFPPIVALLRACADAEDELRRERARVEPEPLEVLPTWLTDADAREANPNTLEPVIARGEWDRVWAHAALCARRRREYHAERTAYWRIALGPRAASDKTIAIIAAGGDAARFDPLPTVSVADVDDELRAMSHKAPRTIGGLRGSLEAALAWRLDFEK